MKKIGKKSVIYRLFFQQPLLVREGREGGETFLERAFVFKQYLRFCERMSIFSAQSYSRRIIKRGCDFFSRYGFRVLGAIFLSSSLYFFLFRFAGSHFTLFEFFFYLYLFFLGFFFFILGNHLPDYYEASRLKKYFFSKEVPGR